MQRSGERLGFRKPGSRDPLAMKAFTLEYEHFAPPDLTPLEVIEPYQIRHIQARFLLIFVRDRTPLMRVPIVLGELTLPTLEEGEYTRILIRPNLLIPHNSEPIAWKHLMRLGYYPDKALLDSAVENAIKQFRRMSIVSHKPDPMFE